MKRRKIITLILSIAVLSGCATSWVKLDNSKADSVKINEAKKNCNVDEIRYVLSHMEIGLEAAKAQASSETAEEAIEQKLIDLELEAEDKINTCMRTEGLKPGS